MQGIDHNLAFLMYISLFSVCVCVLLLYPRKTQTYGIRWKLGSISFLFFFHVDTMLLLSFAASLNFICFCFGCVVQIVYGFFWLVLVTAYEHIKTTSFLKRNSYYRSYSYSYSMSACALCNIYFSRRFAVVFFSLLFLFRLFSIFVVVHLANVVRLYVSSLYSVCM